MMVMKRWNISKQAGCKGITYAQTHGIDYEHTFFLIVKFSSIRALVAFAVQNNTLLHQMDVVTAFLNGRLEEKIFLQQPDGCAKEGSEHLVCRG